MKCVQRAHDLLKESPMPRFHAHDDLPLSPPPEVLSQVDAAWERARDLHEAGVEVHFEIDELFGGVSAVLRTRDGSVSERLSAREALAVSCGDPLVRTSRFETALLA
jgi:hypothetical protein